MTTIEPAEPRSTSRVDWALYGPSGLRAGWRLLIFLALVFGLVAAVIFPLRHALRGLGRENSFVIVLAIRIVVVLFASWIMAKIEGRTIADYGLPWRKMFGRHFWIGSLGGFAALTFLLCVLQLTGAFQFGGLALHGRAIVRFGIMYAVGFVLVGLREEFENRGYLLFTLSSGLGFWPAALISSILFGASHRGNSGESWVGVISAGLAGFIFCVILRKSGNLWMAIGAHAGWDWGESFFYGVADSGQTSPQHLFNSASSGPVWLSGGSVGPEGSWLCILLFVALGIAIVTLFRTVRYPDPVALAASSRFTIKHDAALSDSQAGAASPAGSAPVDFDDTEPKP